MEEQTLKLDASYKKIESLELENSSRMKKFDDMV